MPKSPIQIHWLRQPRRAADSIITTVIRHLSGIRELVGLPVYDEARLEEYIFTIATHLAQSTREGQPPGEEHLALAWDRLDRAAGHRVKRFPVDLTRPIIFIYPYGHPAARRAKRPRRDGIMRRAGDKISR